MVFFDGVLETIPFDEPHGVERPAVGVGAQTVNRHDPRMFQAASDLSFEDKTRSAFLVVGPLVLDFLESDLTVQFLVVGDGDLAKAPFRMRSNDAETLSCGGGQADRNRGYIALSPGPSTGGTGKKLEGGLHLGIGNQLKILADRRAGADRSQALLRVVFMLLEMLHHERVEKHVASGAERLLRDEDVSKRLALVKHPGMHGGDELIAGDKIHLQGENAEEEIPISIAGARGGHNFNLGPRDMSEGRCTVPRTKHHVNK